MSRFYLMSQPFRMNATGHIHLAQHIDEHFSNITYRPLCLNDYTEFGFIDGSGESLSEVLMFCSKSFNVERIFEDEFIGALSLYWNEEINPETEEVTKTLKQLLDEFSVSYSGTEVDKVYYAKRFKIKEFKQICKNEFTDYNDLIANLSKTLLLLNEYDGNLTTDQQERLDNCVTAMKNIYNVESCLSALEEDISQMSTFMPDYYAAKVNVNNLTELEDIKNATYR